MSQDKFKEIRPYLGDEVLPAFARIASNPTLNKISAFLYPGEDPSLLREKLLSLKSGDQFQSEVMLHAINKIVSDTTKKLTYSGVEKLSDQNKVLFISNHRDILLDSAMIQVILHMNNLITSEMAVGDNLITDQLMEDIARSNKMIKVARSGNPKEFYNSSLLLSQYIRESVVKGRSSVWIAQRNGRTKNGTDETEQGLLKMFNMSGNSSFQENFRELNLTPISISYEYEPCDFLKARELYISRERKYEKGPREDLNSILTGIMQYKGNVHIHFCDPLTIEEIAHCDSMEKNDKFIKLAQLIDSRIISDYKIWNSNKIAYDLLNSTSCYQKEYSKEEMESFKNYCDLQIAPFEGDKEELRTIFLSIYANPICSKKREKV